MEARTLFCSDYFSMSLFSLYLISFPIFVYFLSVESPFVKIALSLSFFLTKIRKLKKDLCIITFLNFLCTEQSFDPSFAPSPMQGLSPIECSLLNNIKILKLVLGFQSLNFSLFSFQISSCVKTIW